MAREIYLKNTTSNVIVIFGWRIDPSATLFVDPIEYTEFARNDTLFTYIANGDIIVNDGSKDLTIPTEGWRHIIGDSNNIAIKDGDNIALYDNVEKGTPSYAALLAGINGDDNANILQLTTDRNAMVIDYESIHLLNKILKELKKLNHYHMLMMDDEITNSDIEAE